MKFKQCEYTSCIQCGACGVCEDFHGDHYGGCSDISCPYTRWQQILDWLRRHIWARNRIPPWLEM